MAFAAAGVACAAAGLGAWAYRGALYDALIVKSLTARWYGAALAELEDGAVVADVGVGTGAALLAHAGELKRRKLRVVGVEYDSAYVSRARALAAAAERREELAAGAVSVRHASVYDAGALAAPEGSARFDAVYFSGSLTLLPDPAEALRLAARATRSGGKVIVTQTYQRDHFLNPLFRVSKPLLRFVTTVDFGKLTTEHDLARVLQDAGLEVLANAPLAGSVDVPWQVARLVVLRVP